MFKRRTRRCDRCAELEKILDEVAARLRDLDDRQRDLAAQLIWVKAELIGAKLRAEGSRTFPARGDPMPVRRTFPRPPPDNDAHDSDSCDTDELILDDWG